MAVPVISVVGKSDSGKTTLMEKLLTELKKRGHRVGTIKHDVHGFEIDHPGKDTWRHRRAGADVVVISSPTQVAMIRQVEREQTLDEIVAAVTGVDLIITEGYKRQDKPKIEVFRSEKYDTPLCSEDDRVFAVAADRPVKLPVPTFDWDDAAGICDLIENLFLKEKMPR